MKTTGHVSSGFAKHPAYKYWVSVRSLQLLEARRSTPINHEFGNKQRFQFQKIIQSLREDRETWWSERDKELETAFKSVNC